MKKEKWISDIMNSLDESPKLAAPKYLFDNIENQIANSNSSIIPIRYVLGIAAGFLVLVALNIQFISQSSNYNFESNKHSTITSYLEIESNQLY